MDFVRALMLGLVQGVLLFGLCLGDEKTGLDASHPVKFDFAQWCEVGSHRFTLETITLGEVAKELGSGQVVNVDVSDPGNADPLWALYYRSDDNVVRFEADGDMGGPEHRITGISIGPAASFPPGHYPSLSEPTKFRFGQIGMSFSEVEHRLGSAGLLGATATFEYSGTTKIPSRKDILGDSKSFDVTGYLTVEVVDSKVVKIALSHITTD